MERSDTIDALAKALVRVQGTMENAVKGADNPFFKSSYATLSDIWEVARKPLTENGLSVTQLCESADGQNVIIETVLLHESGQWIGGRLSMPYLKNDPQAVGSAISYGRRYALQSILGIVAEEDDDANHASGKVSPPNNDNPHPPPKAPVPPPAPPAKTDEFQPSLIEGMDCKQAQVKMNGWLMEMANGDKAVAENILDDLTKWTTKEGKDMPGVKSAFHLKVKANSKGTTQTSMVYHDVKKAYTKWSVEQAAPEEEGGMVE